MTDKNVGFIGWGRMGGALAQGSLAAGVLSAKQMMAFDPDSNAKARIKTAKLKLAGSIAEVVEFADIIFLCVKPQQMSGVLKELSSTPVKAQLPDKCLVSIAAGITLARIARDVGDTISMIRVMPNTPALIGKGMSVMSPGARATKQQIDLVKRILKSVGEVLVEVEHLMDAVTAVSGSGPAYVFYLAEAMTEAGVELGLSRELSAQLVRQTVCGAGHLMGVRKESAQELREQVTSPGGTTAAAVQEFDARGFKEIVKAALIKAAQRSVELSQV